MRKIELQDAFRLSEIIDTLGIELDLKELLEKVKKQKEEKLKKQNENSEIKSNINENQENNKNEDKKDDIVENIGAQVALLVIKKLHKAENQIYKFIASLTEEKPEVVKRYRPSQIVEFFEQLFADEELNSFFN